MVGGDYSLPTVSLVHPCYYFQSVTCEIRLSSTGVGPTELITEIFAQRCIALLAA
jgi:hypothetical protein